MNLLIDNIEIPVRPSEEHEWLLSSELVAKGYGVSEVTVRRHKQAHADELFEGVHWIAVQNLNADSGRSQKNTLWTKTGVITLGFFIGSERAKQFRAIAAQLILRVIEHKPDIEMLRTVVRKHDEAKGLYGLVEHYAPKADTYGTLAANGRRRNSLRRASWVAAQKAAASLQAAREVQAPLGFMNQFQLE